MMKRLLLCLMVLSIGGFWSPVHAAEMEINDYVFTWYAASVEDVKMNIEKRPSGVKVILSSPGGGLARLAMSPAQAVAIGEVLKKTSTYYDKQMEKEEINAEDLVNAGDFKVYFKSSRGRKFQVTVRGSGALSAAVLMSKDQALGIAPSLLKAQEMVAMVNERIRL